MLHQPGRASHHTSYIIHQHQHDTWPRPLGCTCEPAKLEPCWNLPVHRSIGAAGAIPNSWRSHPPSSIIHHPSPITHHPSPIIHPICKPSSVIHQSVIRNPQSAIRNPQSAICNLQPANTVGPVQDFRFHVMGTEQPLT